MLGGWSFSYSVFRSLRLRGEEWVMVSVLAKRCELFGVNVQADK